MSKEVVMVHTKVPRPFRFSIREVAQTQHREIMKMDTGCTLTGPEMGRLILSADVVRDRS